MHQKIKLRRGDWFLVGVILILGFGIVRLTLRERPLEYELHWEVRKFFSMLRLAQASAMHRKIPVALEVMNASTYRFSQDSTGAGRFNEPVPIAEGIISETTDMSRSQIDFAPLPCAGKFPCERPLLVFYPDGTMGTSGELGLNNPATQKTFVIGWTATGKLMMD